MNKRIRINGDLYEAVDDDRWGLTTEEGDVPSGWKLVWRSVDHKEYAERHYEKDDEGLVVVAEVTLQKDLPAHLGVRISDSEYVFLDHVEADNDTTFGEILDRVDVAVDKVAKYIVKHPVLVLSRIFNGDHRMTTTSKKNKDITKILKKYLKSVR